MRSMNFSQSESPEAAKKAAKVAKKQRKVEHLQFLTRAQNKRAYWELTLEQNAGYIKQINLKIMALVARREKLTVELADAPAQIKSWQKECERLSAMTGDKGGQQDKLVQKYLRIKKQMEKLELSLSDLKLSEEEVTLLKQAAGKANIASA